MAKRDIIVIGASAGGLDAVSKLVRELPSTLPASLFFVWHMAADSPSFLPQILSQEASLPAVHPRDKDAIQRGRIYVAVPDHHLLVEAGRVRVTRGPKENRFRPAVDPLFRSAAQAYGSRVIGVILSGNLDDGTAVSPPKLGGVATAKP
jgi:two-component system, chemotaxis family, protein-glutamate methylesterase/glutaminase